MTEWREQAACLPYPPSVFFPAGEGGRGSSRPSAVKAAQAICASCPVKVDCACEAMASGAVAGVWAGVDLEGCVTVAVARRPLRRMIEADGREVPSQNQRWRHGTTYGWSTKNCRCQECHEAILAKARARDRAAS